MFLLESIIHSLMGGDQCHHDCVLLDNLKVIHFSQRKTLRGG